MLVSLIHIQEAFTNMVTMDYRIFETLQEDCNLTNPMNLTNQIINNFHMRLPHNEIFRINGATPIVNWHPFYMLLYKELTGSRNLTNFDHCDDIIIDSNELDESDTLMYYETYSKLVIRRFCDENEIIFELKYKTNQTKDYLFKGILVRNIVVINVYCPYKFETIKIKNIWIFYNGKFLGVGMCYDEEPDYLVKEHVWIFEKINQEFNYQNWIISIVVIIVLIIIILVTPKVIKIISNRAIE